MKIAEVLNTGEVPQIADERLLAYLQKIQKAHPLRVKLTRPEHVGQAHFPELIVDVPQSWPHVDIAPLFDVHLGNSRHLSQLFAKHLKWLRHSPYVLTFDGGDFVENASKLSVGSGVYQQDFNPDNQFVKALVVEASLSARLLFKLPGNHEARTMMLGVDVARWVALALGIPYFPDFCFCTIRFAGNNFRLLAQHGTGAATTAGAQRMAARKMLPWAKGFDIIWTGHLHNPLVDVIYQTDFDQQTCRAFERNGLVLISPSYMGYFGTYAAQKMYQPGVPGLHVVRLHKDGRIDANVHARGRRL